MIKVDKLWELWELWNCRVVDLWSCRVVELWIFTLSSNPANKNLSNKSNHRIYRINRISKYIEFTNLPNLPIQLPNNRDKHINNSYNYNNSHNSNYHLITTTFSVANNLFPNLGDFFSCTKYIPFGYWLIFNVVDLP